jgi:hypothetical protein
MKREISGLIIGLLLAGSNVFAADGDLIVNGKVGIGTVSPIYKLDLAGPFRLNSDGGGNSLHMSAFNDSVTRIDSTGDINLQREVSLMLGGADNYHNTYIWNGKTSGLSVVASFIGSSGNVGIGTTNPAGKLDINGGIFYLRDRGDNCCAEFVMIKDSGQQTHLYSYDDGRFGIHKYGSGSIMGEVFSILKGGNVGIGTTGPTKRLTVGGGGFQLLGGGHSGVYEVSSLIMDFDPASNQSTRFWSIGSGTTKGRFDFIIRDGNGNAIIPFAIDNSGNVGIGTTNPGSYKLYVNGSAYSTGGWQSSDLRFKENIKPIESPLNKILNMEGISFDWKKDEFKDKGFPEGRHYGVVAQKVEKVLPEVVKEGPGGEKSVSYTEIVPVLIEAIKEQQKEIERLKMEVTELKTRN